MNLKSNLVKAIACLSMLFSFVANAEQSVADSNYRLQAGDVVMVSVWGEETMQMKDLRVLPDGSISFPLIGSTIVAGSTTGEVSTLMAEKLKSFLPEPQVTIVVTGIDGNRVYVVGKVSRPGPMPLVTQMSVLQALSVAGGLDRFADKSNVKILRITKEGQIAIPVDYESLLKGKKLDSNILLQSGDTIVVP